MQNNFKKTLKNPTWSRDELILALNLYMKHRGTAPRKNDPEILDLSLLLNKLGDLLGKHNDTFRNPAGVYMKLMNFRRFDPDFIVQGKLGLKQGSHDEEIVWQKYANRREELQRISSTIAANIELGDKNSNELFQDMENFFEADEGQILARQHMVRERSRKLVAKKKASVLKNKGKLECEGCGFNFEYMYGERGNSCIEVHHTKPLMSLMPGTKTSTKDLALVCANCHRIIHAKKPWLTIMELHALLLHKH
jgi:5-methylcytosine-specific restriction protein A